MHVQKFETCKFKETIKYFHQKNYSDGTIMTRKIESKWRTPQSYKTPTLIYIQVRSGNNNCVWEIAQKLVIEHMLFETIVGVSLDYVASVRQFHQKSKSSQYQIVFFSINNCLDCGEGCQKSNRIGICTIKILNIEKSCNILKQCNVAKVSIYKLHDLHL